MRHNSVKYFFMPANRIPKAFGSRCGARLYCYYETQLRRTLHGSLQYSAISGQHHYYYYSTNTVINFLEKIFLKAVT